MNVVTAARHRARALARHRGEHGAVAVEFALILPILVTLLLGLTTTGLVYSDHLAITNAAREGARYGSAVSNSSATTWGDSVQQRVQQVYFNSGSSLSTAQICAKLYTSTGTDIGHPTTQGTACGTEPTAPSSPPTNSCYVVVWIRKPASINLGLVKLPTFNIGARSVSYYQRTDGTCTAN